MPRKFLFILLACLGGASVASAQTTLQIVGSDLLQVAIAEPLGRYIKQNGLDAKVDFNGTLPAMSALKDGKALLAIVAAPVGQAPAPAGYTVIKFCYQVDYLLVNQANPLNALDMRQIVAVFGTADQNFTHWEQLNLAGDWTTRPIVPVTTSADDGVVLELFRYVTLGRLTLSPTIRVMSTSDDMVKEVSSDFNAIGLGGYDPGPPAKVLLITASKNPTPATAGADATAADAVSPSELNVNNGQYPLCLPFYLVFKPADKAKLREILRLLLSDEYATHLRDQHFMPVPDTDRNLSLLELDKPD